MADEPEVVVNAPVVADGPYSKREPVRLSTRALAAVEAVIVALVLMDVINWTVEQMAGVMGAIAAVTVFGGEAIRARVSPVPEQRQGF